MRKKDNIEALSIQEIAEKHGMFPSDVEEACKKLHGEGLIICRMHKGTLYVEITEEGVQMDDLLSRQPPEDTKKKDSIMYG